MTRTMVRALLVPVTVMATIAVCAGQPVPQGGTSKPAGGAQHAGQSTTAAPTTAAGVMQIKRQITGDFVFRFAPLTEKPDVIATAPVPLPASVSGENVVLAVPSSVSPKTHVLEILDNGRGNVARLPITLTGVTPLTESSFTLAQRISIPIQSKNAGVVGAQVTMTSADKKYSQTRLLQPDDQGVARFDSVPLNQPVTVTVSYGSNPPESQTRTLTVTRPPDVWPPIAVTWPDVKTVAPALSAVPAAAVNPGARPPDSGHRTMDDDTRPARQPDSNPLNSLVSTVISLLFLGAIGYGLFYAYRSGMLKNMLDRLGVNTDPIAATSGAVPDPFVKPRAPIQPITEGTADPFAGAAAVGVSATAPVADGPRLIATSGTYAGNIFPLKAPSTDIGRDAGNAVPLPNDTNASRRHATIQANEGQYLLVDNGSSNGTFVNGVRVAALTPQKLRPGDEVQIGLTRFRFEA